MNDIDILNFMQKHSHYPSYDDDYDLTNRSYKQALMSPCSSARFSIGDGKQLNYLFCVFLGKSIRVGRLCFF